jgi:hypothetical protein
VLDADPARDDGLDAGVCVEIGLRRGNARPADLVLELTRHLLHDDLGLGRRINRELDVPGQEEVR